jgi:TolB-like protein
MDPKPSFWSELNRRHVVKVAVMYVLVGVGVIEAADLVFPTLNVPGWAFTLVVVFTLLGFPIALTLAWAFDMTPDGVVRTPGSESAGSGAMAEAGSGSVASADAGKEAGRTSEPVQGADTPSIAVLPFADMSPDGDQEYFGDGISEELINVLVKVPGFRVSARTSSFQFKGQTLDVTEIGRTLNVAAVLEGSVRKAGNQLRITAQLIDVDDGFHIWSETYDRTLDDVFAIQDELSSAIVQACVASMGDEVAIPDRRLTKSSEAYDFYLQGRYLWMRRYDFGLKTAAEYFQKAVEIDPSYALAWAGLSDVYSIVGHYEIISRDDAHAQAVGPITKAMELGPDLPETQFSQALFKYEFEMDLRGAAEGFRRAEELRPGFGNALGWLAITLAQMGLHEEAAAAADRAREAEPDALYVRSIWAVVPAFSLQTGEARRRLEGALEADPDHTISRYFLALVEICAERWPQAVEHAGRALATAPDEPFFLGIYGQALRGSGDHEGAEKIIARLEAMQESRFVSRYAVAVPRLGSPDPDDHEVVMQLLLSSFDTSATFIATQWGFPYWNPFRRDPRIIAAIERSGVALPGPDHYDRIQEGASDE